jgi:hypothetical protein
MTLKRQTRYILLGLKLFLIALFGTLLCSDSWLFDGFQFIIIKFVLLPLGLCGVGFILVARLCKVEAK